MRHFLYIHNSSLDYFSDFIIRDLSVGYQLILLLTVMTGSSHGGDREAAGLDLREYAGRARGVRREGWSRHYFISVSVYRLENYPVTFIIRTKSGKFFNYFGTILEEARNK